MSFINPEIDAKLAKLREFALKSNEEQYLRENFDPYVLEHTVLGKNNVFGITPSVGEQRESALLGGTEQAHEVYTFSLTSGHFDTHGVYDLQHQSQNPRGIHCESFEELSPTVTDLANLSNVEILDKCDLLRSYALGMSAMTTQKQLNGLIAFDECWNTLKESDKDIRFRVNNNQQKFEFINGEAGRVCLTLNMRCDDEGNLIFHNDGAPLTAEQLKEIQQVTRKKFENIREKYQTRDDQSITENEI